jgi:hypothetical protein
VLAQSHKVDVPRVPDQVTVTHCSADATCSTAHVNAAQSRCRRVSARSTRHPHDVMRCSAASPSRAIEREGSGTRIFSWCRRCVRTCVCVCVCVCVCACVCVCGRPSPSRHSTHSYAHRGTKHVIVRQPSVSARQAAQRPSASLWERVRQHKFARIRVDASKQV